MVIWYILWLFGIFCGYLVYFMVIWYIFSVLACCTSQNLATLVRRTERELERKQGTLGQRKAPMYFVFETAFANRFNLHLAINEESFEIWGPVDCSERANYSLQLSYNQCSADHYVKEGI
jgi:hypothetical protein